MAKDIEFTWKSLSDKEKDAFHKAEAREKELERKRKEKKKRRVKQAQEHLNIGRKIEGRKNGGSAKKKKPLTKDEARELGLTGGADKRGYRMRTTRLNTHEFRELTDPNKKMLVPPRDVIDGVIQKYGHELKKKNKKVIKRKGGGSAKGTHGQTSGKKFSGTY